MRSVLSWKQNQQKHPNKTTNQYEFRYKKSPKNTSKQKPPTHKWSHPIPRSGTHIQISTAFLYSINEQAKDNIKQAVRFAIASGRIRCLGINYRQSARLVN